MRGLARSCLLLLVLASLASAPAIADGGDAATQKININQASASQFAFLPRVGAKAAERIVEYRKTHGQFTRTEELMEVKGIGEKLFLQLKPYVTLSGPTTLSAKVSSKGSRGGSSGKKAASNSVPLGKGR